MKVLLVGNYAFDGSTSMHIWANALRRELLQLEIQAELIFPKPSIWQDQAIRARGGKVVRLY